MGGHDLSGADTRPLSLASPLDPKLYTVNDEPIGPDRVIDYRFLYEIVRDRLARQEDRGKSLDAKLATLLTGVVAAIGFSFRLSPSLVTTGTAFLYLLPLVLIASAFSTKLSDLAPDIESLERSFPPYPVSTLMAAVAAIREAHRVTLAAYDRKASRLDHAIAATLLVTSGALVAQLAVALGLLH
ncbi:MAG TPA: hypothetical protein VK669_01080 [Candidatus Limnocylindrales bacterium]|nr:hypothetical protein [Candidatus Limnocylindrales bacterium]